MIRRRLQTELEQLLAAYPAVALLGHPVCGQSWEGFVIENCLAVAPPHCKASFYRTSAGAECDLLITFPDQKTWTIEIKRNLAPTLSKGFYFAQSDIKPEASFVAYPGQETYPMNETVQAIGLINLIDQEK
ncbi:MULTISPECIES: DUF4143 domain-containing protein [Methylomicrobium]|uniref:DUF4143 domain-containing protein n=1 Tax=Methylomicrobium TaxID=39773 RepID=UPI001BC87682|nr:MULTISPECIES: DUF4143 domain-containing protein [Methylomicrobium]